MFRPAILSLFVCAVASTSAFCGELPDDPLKSVMWRDMANRFLAGGDIIFDQRVRVMIPASAEDQLSVPVTVDASSLPGVSEIVVLADLNPIPRVLAYRPADAEPFIAFRLKVEQSTAVRAAVRTFDGAWHVGGGIVDAAGGGCSVPAAAHGLSNWTATLGQTKALVNRIGDNNVRVSVRMRHPMDTGLATGIPAFYLSNLAIAREDGSPVADLDLFEPVSENPTFTFKAAAGPGVEDLQFSARDTEGNIYRYRVAIPARQAAD